MMRHPDKCEKQWKTKLRWQKQKEKEQKKEFRKLIVEEEIEIARIVEEKQE